MNNFSNRPTGLIIAQYSTLKLENVEYSDLYHYLETVLENPEFIGSEIKKKFVPVDDAQLQKIAELEVKCFEFYFNNGTLEPIASWQSKNGEPQTYPDLATFTADDVGYLKLRIDQTKNFFVRARYGHLLWRITKHNSYAIIAADNYLELSLLYLQLSLTKKPEFYNYIQALHCFHNLSAGAAYQVQNCRAVLVAALTSADLPPLWKDNIADVIVDSSLFKRKDCIGLTDKLLLFFPANKVEHFDPERFLKTCARLAQKEGRTLKDIYDRLGENELDVIRESENDNSGMIAMSSYQKATHYFRLAGNTARQRYASEMYTQQKANIRLSLFQHELDPGKFKQLMERYDSLVSRMFESGEPVAHLSYNKNFLQSEENLQTKTQEEIKSAGFMNFVNTQVFDNNNNPHTLITDDDRLEHARSQSYMFTLQLLTLTILFKFVKKGIKEKLLNPMMITAYLKSTWFSGSISEFGAEDSPQTFSWNELILPALLDIFHQFQLKVDNKEYQENYIMSIDSLGTKIEGIIRDLARLNGKTVSKVKEKEVTEMNLEDMLADKDIHSLFTTEDRMLFRYILTRRGLNIRNNIAHAFYRPSDYSPEKAMLLFLTVFRLSKYEIPSGEAG